MQGKRLLAEVSRRPLALVPARPVTGVNPGGWASPREGRGYEPRGYRDFVMGDNPRQLHMPTSARRGVATVVERVALTELTILVVVDLSASIQQRSKPRIQHEAAALLLHAAWQAETTFALAAWTPSGLRRARFGIGLRHFYRTFNLLWQLCSNVDPDFVGRRLHPERCLPTGGVLMWLSDFLDDDGGIEGAGRLLRGVRHYDFLPVVIQDELEYGFPELPVATLVNVANPETGRREDAWIDSGGAAELAERHAGRFAGLLCEFSRRDLQHVHLAEPGVDGIRARLASCFRQRRRQ